MITPRMGFIVYGVHKDGLKDPMGNPFIDDQVVANSKKALTERGIELVVHETVVANKEETTVANSGYPPAGMEPDDGKPARRLGLVLRLFPSPRGEADPAARLPLHSAPP